MELVQKKFAQVKLIKNKENSGFAAGNNLALKKAKANYFMLLNSDTIVQPESIDKLIQVMDTTDYGVASCKLVFADRSFQPNGGDLPFLLPVFVWLAGLDDILPGISRILPSFHRKFQSYYQGTKEIGWVSGSVFLIRKNVLERVGLLDNKIFMYGEDVEYCYRVRKAGFKVGWTDQAEIIHLGGGSSKNPAYNQWVGELKGLKYIYRKHFGKFNQLLLNILLYFFTGLRAIAFLILGKPKIAQTYVKVLQNI